MQITEIIVSAGRTFNHPYEQYSNLKPHVTLKATVAAGEDAEAAAKELQAQAEKLVEDHKQQLLRSIEELQQMSEAQQRLANLGKLMRNGQAEIDRLRERYPGLTQVALPGDVGDDRMQEATP